ncbi:hypothetical protein NBRC3257_2968 [Gluconobacter thailandicus NBRC 3257]|uniref:Uncharacterized protein n=1 Tax=Gluconobacter thailandicus NBRC 3257 TaxID=1381097 RepID=A0ABQ0J0L1_GLUTH|nr:hypothetical protein B932_2591 [Gluconobacter oxydans H24]GAC86783.1 hypothetical protein NBRC3255_0444 [Gluconobacter thailandicus NBRC 3255]GAD27969.1 hypothetical protein NBRC3257_2968 [Gluconobacter thailandicus NBRC 3257]
MESFYSVIGTEISRVQNIFEKNGGGDIITAPQTLCSNVIARL